MKRERPDVGDPRHAKELIALRRERLRREVAELARDDEEMRRMAAMAEADIAEAAALLSQARCLPGSDG